MKQLLLYLFFFLIVCGHGISQVVFQKTFGGDATDVGLSVRLTNDNGYIITGYTTSYDSTGYREIYLVKTDSIGTETWLKTYGWSYGVCVNLTDDYGYIITGRTGGWHHLIKTNGMGDTLWSKGFSFPGSATRGRWVQQTTDGGYISVGQRFFMNAGLDMYAVKTDSLGDTIWMKTYYNFNTGTQAIDFDFRVHQTQDLGFIMSSVSGQLFLLKLDSTGNGLWLKYYSGNGGSKSSSMSITNDKGYIMVCSSDTLGAGGSDVYIIRTDSAGNVMWAKTYGGTGDDYGESVQQTYDGGYIIQGYTSSFGFGGNDVYLIKIDFSGNVEWSNTYGGGGDDYGYSMQQTTDSGYVIVGKTNSFGAGNDDVYFIKTDANGSIGECNITAVSTTVTSVSPIVTMDTVIIAPGGIAFNTQTVANNIALVSCNACNPLILTTDSINNVQCNGDTTGAVYISVTGGTPPYSYLWNDPAAQTDSMAIGLPSGTYTVVITDFNSCSAIDSMTVTEPPAIFDSASTTICSNDSVFVQGEYQNTAGVYYDTLISVNGCDSVSITTLMVNPTHTTNTPDLTICTNQAALIFGVLQTIAGIYYDSLITSTGCDSIISTTLTVDPLPNIDLGVDTIICAGCSITLDAGIGFTNYSWSTGASSQTIIVDSTGSYSVQITDANGCSNVDTVVIDITSEIRQSGIYIHQSLIIYPNPNTGQFTLEMDLQEETRLSIQLYHFTGQLIHSEVIGNVNGNYTQQMDLSGYSKGVYFMHISTDHSVLTRKVVFY